MIAQTMPAAPWFPEIMVSADAGLTSAVLDESIAQTGDFEGRVKFVDMAVASTLMGRC